jgi:acyl carrier protein
METIESQVRKLIAEELQIEESAIPPEATIADLGGDSLKSLMLVSAFETHFNISIADEDAIKIKSVKTAVEVIMRLQEQCKDGQ